ncbi:bifunctional glutamate N-acetyltransferase/amino-acid acetyltransferase ArgJ [Alkalibacter mobilis]|uniref:bifunctional glutamate N-acetyltransferase/amino-acid acetyltransferase ArgJ n=1 Tax=Alkalibacter mobilis TaxID=2787712 RepID=UPI00189D38C0|nr:bifunctional glutamate N-acetyltransferase/amino-acid acetyltransferase ArgJ [Alkalibacter mobilis]MBF7096518.1 bifunctional glutamate N-acetyltransferase/amino-acid acetyltransferase ArgJ [Alkalibacter mobilis]
MHIVEGAINKPAGFKAAGKHIGVKKKRKDLAIVFSEKPAVFAAMFTTNKVKAAPVLWNMKIYDSEKPIKAIVVNSGNANACTGVRGSEDTEKMASATAKALECQPEEVFVASTGVIGVPLPIELITEGISVLAKEVSDEMTSGLNASEAIMTTDTTMKVITVETEIGGKVVTISGMAKGSGMIHPNMATMLSFITTDVDISQDLLRKALKEIGKDTYNMISVDGDTSTNDMVMVMANGMAQNPAITDENNDFHKFYKALYHVNEHLAKEIVKDGEGASKFLEVTLEGAKTEDDARMLVKSVLTSNLVKTAMFGEDANWGRILCAMGYSEADFDPEGTSLEFEGGGQKIILMKEGLPIAFDEDFAYGILQNRDIKINISLEDGQASATGWGCDLSYEYVKINGEYRS